MLNAPAPRGIRNNNPGNIDRNATKWQGLALDQSSDPRFCVFVNAQYGLRAIGKILITYNDKYALNTVRKLISRWAPPNENDTTSYINSVSKRIGVNADDAIDVRNRITMTELIRAIVQHENGIQPYTDTQLQDGAALAVA